MSVLIFILLYRHRVNPYSFSNISFISTVASIIFFALDCASLSNRSWISDCLIILRIETC